MSLSIVILAAGVGKRMVSQLPKVLHLLGGKTLLERTVHTTLKLKPAQPPLVVYGYQGETVRHTLANLNVQWIEQTEQLGTGHAVLQALPHIPLEDRVLILYGDVPLISLATLKRFIAETPLDAVGIITAHLSHPADLGRVIRDANNKIIRVVEERDANETQRAINEINSGIYLIPAHYLKKWLPKLTPANAQQEYYLTDIINSAVEENIPIHSIQPQHYEEVLGVNDRVQLAHLERFYQRQCAEAFMRQGVTLLDPDRFDVRGELVIGKDVTIDVNVIIEGHVTIGNNCVIGPNTLLRNMLVGDNVEIKANSVIDGAEIASDCVIGPFARIRPGTVIDTQAHIGNFVEIKNSLIGSATKINHLSYIGDSEVGKQVNIGAGTITCNYDGANKNHTVIKDNVFVGSNAVLVAPLTIGEGAYIAAGSTITRDAPANQLTICRARSRTIEHWKRPNKLAKEK